MEAEETLADGSENPAVFRVGRILPEGDTAVYARGAAEAGVGIGIEGPEELAGSRVEGLHLDESRGDVHDTVDDDGRAFDGGGGPLDGIFAVVDPGDLEALDVAAI